MLDLRSPTRRTRRNALALLLALAGLLGDGLLPLHALEHAPSAAAESAVAAADADEGRESARAECPVCDLFPGRHRATLPASTGVAALAERSASHVSRPAPERLPASDPAGPAHPRAPPLA